MSLQAISVNQMVILTSTTSTQTTTVPANGGESMVIYNGGANTVYFKWAASIAIPATGTWTPSIISVAPGTTQSFSNDIRGGSFSYIAVTAGGLVIISLGEGV